MTSTDDKDDDPFIDFDMDFFDDDDDFGDDDDTMEIFECSSCGARDIRSPGERRNTCVECIMRYGLQKEKKCSCGAAKTNNPNCHSDWCDIK